MNPGRTLVGRWTAVMAATAATAATPDEVAAALPGDDIVAEPDVVMNRAFTVGAPPEQVWPWLVQLGKRRAGWYLPSEVERRIPRSRRAARGIEPQWQQLAVGAVVPDYGGRDASFEVAVLEAPTVLVYRSRRGRTEVSWAITLTPRSDTDATTCTRVQLRLRLGPVRHRWLATTVGDFVDLITIAGMASGLRERLSR